MTKFEEIGVERQLECCSKAEADKYFAHSCDVCCKHGMKIVCDRCSIAYVHEEVLACFDAREMVKQAQAKRKGSMIPLGEGDAESVG